MEVRTYLKGSIGAYYNELSGQTDSKVLQSGDLSGIDLKTLFMNIMHRGNKNPLKPYFDNAAHDLMILYYNPITWESHAEHLVEQFRQLNDIRVVIPNCFMIAYVHQTLFMRKI